MLVIYNNKKKTIHIPLNLLLCVGAPGRGGEVLLLLEVQLEPPVDVLQVVPLTSQPLYSHIQWSWTCRVKVKSQFNFDGKQKKGKKITIFADPAKGST